jgi:hypothetical protein
MKTINQLASTHPGSEVRSSDKVMPLGASKVFQSHSLKKVRTPGALLQSFSSDWCDSGLQKSILFSTKLDALNKFF